jgi:hypothetical protein
MKFQYSDGGRSLYFSGAANGDCVTRAFSLGLNKSYLEIYELVNKKSQLELEDIKKKGIGKKEQDISSAGGGVYPKTIRKIADHFGLKYKKKSGRIDKLKGRYYILMLAEHMTCIRDGILLDTHDCSDLEYIGYYEL